VRASIEDAARAREEANLRLVTARDLVAVQRERARAERVTIIAAIRKMRESNNLSGLIFDGLEQEMGAADDAGKTGR